MFALCTFCFGSQFARLIVTFLAHAEVFLLIFFRFCGLFSCVSVLIRFSLQTIVLFVIEIKCTGGWLWVWVFWASKNVCNDILQFWAVSKVKQLDKFLFNLEKHFSCQICCPNVLREGERQIERERKLVNDFQLLLLLLILVETHTFFSLVMYWRNNIKKFAIKTRFEKKTSWAPAIQIVKKPTQLMLLLRLEKCVHSNERRPEFSCQEHQNLLSL